MRKLGIPFVCLVLFCPAAVSPAVDPITSCAGDRPVPEIVACAEAELGSGLLDRSFLRRLERLVPAGPAAVLELTSRIADRDRSVLEHDPALRAGLFDLEAQALSTLDRAGESAAAYRNALRLDDGAARLAWYSWEKQTPRWTAPLDVGSGRLTRAAQSFLAAGESGEALAALRRARDLGAIDWSETVWPDLPGAPPADGANLRAVVAQDWHKPLIDLELPTFAGESVRLPDEFEGEVALVTFWATWCEPCARELPRVQELFEAERERGLRVLAVNVRESADMALAYARGMDLDLPMARSTPQAERFFDTEKLPVTVLLDRGGRVRGRWAGYRPGVEDEISAMVRRLLTESEPPGRVVGNVLAGSVTPRVLWMRAAPTVIDGITPVPLAGGGRGVLVAAGRSLAIYDGVGRTVSVENHKHSVGRLRGPSRSGPNSEAAFLGFRPGSPALVRFGLSGEELQRLVAPSPVFDVSFYDRPVDDGEGTILLATTGGLLRSGPRNASFRPTGNPGTPVASVAVVGGSGSEKQRVAALEFGGSLVWLGDGLQPTGRTRVDPDAWVLLDGGTTARGIGVAPAVVRAGVAGRFLGGGEFQIALITESGQLLLISTDDGTILLRALWDEITGLAADDLRGDARDELILAVGYL